MNFAELYLLRLDCLVKLCKKFIREKLLCFLFPNPVYCYDPRAMFLVYTLAKMEKKIFNRTGDYIIFDYSLKSNVSSTNY